MIQFTGERTGVGAGAGAETGERPFVVTVRSAQRNFYQKLNKILT